MIGKVAGSLSSSLEVTLLLLTYSSGCIQIWLQHWKWPIGHLLKRNLLGK
jgi:hypothetical protein